MKQYKRYLPKYARQNRKKQTYGEIKLWSKLRAKKFLGINFKRQVPVGNYIADFYSDELCLVIEIDGMSHDELRFDKDVQKQEYLKSVGISILRFNESEVLRNIDNVLQAIEYYVNQT